jgi:acetoin utilization deacetylase AcuC-like enzyme
LGALREQLPRALDRYQPDLVVYNAGSDVPASDPLAQLMLTAEEMAKRDLYVVTEEKSQSKK